MKVFCSINKQGNKQLAQDQMIAMNKVEQSKQVLDLHFHEEENFTTKAFMDTLRLLEIKNVYLVFICVLRILNE